MDNLLASVDSQTVLVISAIVVAFLLLRLLLRILSGAGGLLLTIIAIVLGLQYLFGISPAQLWQEMLHLPQELLRLVESVQLPGS
ncbi:hypothetical protein H6F51_00760 [Cyanobacteria bacterium FACHB-DQ100]|uniref:hypothetical protein n=1 Tax=Leptolyngbya sp. DQ-M1 TaxID=2933920 RepID=UPI0019AB1176|nr:hypothetical protein [Cyanobacteria bacterium FACHB-DQ100]